MKENSSNVNHNATGEKMFSDLRSSLPVLITRCDISRHFGSLLSPGYLANLDSRGEGPPSVTIGRKVAYNRDDLITWLQGRVTRVSKGCNHRGNPEEN